MHSGLFKTLLTDYQARITNRGVKDSLELGEVQVEFLHLLCYTVLWSQGFSCSLEVQSGVQVAQLARVS